MTSACNTMSDTSTSTPEFSEGTLPPQAQLKHFTIIKVLGQGGFGITYLVRDEHLECECVLKENMPRMFCKRNSNTMQVSALTGQYTENGYLWALQRFKEEAKTLAKLNHPNIIRVKDLFDALGTSYYVMEYIDGQELHRATESNRDEATLQHLLRRLLNALQYLHGKGILHRDIKPTNILVTKQGEPVLIDFGTARSLISEHTHTQLKSQGYTPFEQIQTKGKVGPWTDLYALGATFCHVLTGQCPPDSTDRVYEDEFEPLAERVDLTASYSHAFLCSIDKALQPKAKDRWQNVEEWLAALDAKVTETAASPLQSSPEQKDKQDKRSAARREQKKRGITDIHKDREGETPLHEACYAEESETAEMLLQSGANINAKNDVGEPPLEVASQEGHKYMAIIRENARNVVSLEELSDFSQARKTAKAVRAYIKHLFS